MLTSIGENASAATGSSNPRDQAYVGSKTILLYTLNIAQREKIKQHLKLAGYNQILIAESSKQAIELLTSRAIDIVVCDVELGDIDGWQLTRLIRSGALGITPTTPIVIVSSSYSERIAEATARAFQINRFVPYQECSRLPEILNHICNSPEISPTKPRLLVIEDYPDTVELVKRVLGGRFDIEEAITGKAGLDAWRERRHDLVLLDVMLPEMSGRDVLKEILKINPAQPVVMMTARSTPQRAGELILNGAVDFISKPFRTDQLRQVCEIAVQRQDFLISNHEFSQHQEALFHEKELAQITLQSIADGVITTDTSGAIDYINPVAERLSGWNLEDSRGKQIAQILPGFEDDSERSIACPVTACLSNGRPVIGSKSVTFLSRQGKSIKLDHVTSPIRNRLNEVIGTVMVFRDITEAHALEKKLEYQAKHDTLTGLTNRCAFEERLQMVLDQNLHLKTDYTICYIDLDQFKVVNDTCGHTAGDQLLRQVKSIMLSKIRRNHDTLARFGGDEFVLLLQDCTSERASGIAQDICSSIQEFKFSYDDKFFSIGASIGVVPIREEIGSVNEALSMADNACYVAKEKGRNRIHVYHIEDKELIKRRGEMHVVSQMNNAFDKNGFSLFYQDIKPLSLIEPEGMHLELLVRMKGECDNLISPGFFLPAAERYNLAPKIDRWVLSNAIKWFSEHRELLARITKCSINLSGLTFCDTSFSSYIEEQFTRADIPPEKFCFEITETAAIASLQEACDFIDSVKRLGCSFALDDFGSGMSSYAYLKNLPVDYLKIDGMFVKDILEDPVDHAMVKSINDIGHVFGLKTIAEYVESEEIMDELRNIGLDFGQGYHISKPKHISCLL